MQARAACLGAKREAEVHMNPPHLGLGCYRASVRQDGLLHAPPPLPAQRKGHVQSPALGLSDAGGCDLGLGEPPEFL